MSFVSCGCCSGCKPRYKRLVDSIYPAVPTDGLVKGNMQKLTFYSISHPEKLDRIGEYLHYRLGRDVYRQRLGLIRVTVEAMDQLLSACHGSPSLNLFIESFLKMVQKLLETQDADMEVMATESFVNFSNIEEDTPGYHRRYDFFISKFSALCHSVHERSQIRKRLRLAGLKGLRGVVRKTVSDDLQANIWEKQHMDKIVPSILFNIHDEQFPRDVPDSRTTKDGDEEDGASESEPKGTADTCLRELIGKASFGSMKSVLIPVLQHTDNHNLWVPPQHAVEIFSAINYSIQAQYSYVVIQALISHLDLHDSDEAEIRIGIATVLSEIVLIASTSIGPSLLEIFNSLLRHLRSSVEFQSSDLCPSAAAEKRYQETLINTMGDFANSLPDYQKVEIMMFIIGKVPLATSGNQRCDFFLQHVLVKTLLKVATKYRTGHLSTVLSSTFLEPLLKLALVEDAGVRILTQQILHKLLDRHQNLPALQHLDYVSDVAELQLTVGSCSRMDQMFMKKNGHSILSTLYKAALAPNNSVENCSAVLCTLSLLCVEVGCDEVLVELFRLVLGLQNATQDSSVNLSPQTRVDIHNLIAKYMNLSSQLLAIPALCQHVHQIVKLRGQQCHPSLKLHRMDSGEVESVSPETIEELNLGEETLFDKEVMGEALRSSGKDASRLSLPFVPKATSDSLALAGSPTTMVDGGSISFDIASIDSGSPVTSRRTARRNTIFAPRHGHPLTVEGLRSILAQPLDDFQDEEEAKSREIAEMVRSLGFEELTAKLKENSRGSNDSLNRVLQRISEREAANLRCDATKPLTVFELELPQLFVY